MTPRRLVLLASTLVLVAGPGLRDAHAGDPSADTVLRAFPPTIVVETPIGTRSLALTGTAVRTRYFFEIYAVASYVEADAHVHTARGLVETSAARRLELVMLRHLEGARMADAVRKSLERVDPQGHYAKAIDTLDAYIRAHSVSAGDHIRFEAGDRRPFTATITGWNPIVIDDAGFANAVWSIYVGPQPLTRKIKQGLTSRLAQTSRDTPD